MYIEKLIPGGEAISTDQNGKKFFFWGALPGETVTEYQITKDKKSYAEAVAIKYENPSKFRVSPPDLCFLSTSPWQIMDYEYELKQKRLLVQEIFREHNIKIPLPDIITDGQDYHYRNKMEYSLYYSHEDEKIHLAFHARGSHAKVPITNSSLERAEILIAAKKVVENLNASGDEARRYQSLILRCNQKGEVSGGLYENRRPHPAFKNLTDKILDQEYSYSVGGFFQINLPVYELALKEIKKHISTDNVLDLYAGVGTIGLSVARGKHLTLVEVDKSAFKELKKNCEDVSKVSSIKPLTNSLAPSSSVKSSAGFSASVSSGMDSSVTTFPAPLPIFAKSEDALKYIASNQTVILDPPRAGCDHKLIDKLLKVHPEKIIYLSCNPATQARDLSRLLVGYNIKLVKTFNFFPHTPHIENLVVLN